MVEPSAAAPGLGTSGSWSALRRFTRRQWVVERCELCSTELSSNHEHLVEPPTRRLLCACSACAFLFSHQGDAKYRRVPRQSRFLSEFRLTESQWNGLAIPIGLAFFFHSSPIKKIVALYPSPAGPTESLLDLDSWDEIVDENPVLKDLEPDAEALLVSRIGPVPEHFLAPIDECYKLVGLIRMHWQGMSGGTKVWQEIEHFFAALKEQSR